MTPYQLPRTAKSAEFTGPIKSLNSINRRLTHHITLSYTLPIDSLRTQSRTVMACSRRQGLQQNWLKENSATYKKDAPVCPYRSAPLTNEIEDHVEDLLAPEIVLMFGAVD